MDFWDIFPWIIIIAMVAILIWAAVENEKACPGYIVFAGLIFGGLILFGVASDGLSSMVLSIFPNMNQETTEKIGRGILLAYLIACYVYYQKNKKK